MNRDNVLPRPLRVVLGAALERALGRALALDPDSRAALDALEGRRVVLCIPQPPLALTVRVEGGRLRVGPPEPPGEDALAITASLGAVLAQAAPWRDASAPPVGKLAIAGDADLARRVQRLAQQFDPDWDAALARAFGDVAGHQLGKALRGARGWLRDSAAALANDTAEWLTQPAGDLAAAAEIADFCDQVDELRDRVERLHARLALLQEKGPE